MKKIFYIISALLILSACKKPSERPCWKFNAEIKSKDIKLNHMSGIIQLNDDIDIILINDSADKIIVEAPENIIDHIEVIIESGKTIFRNNNRCDFLRNPLPIKINYHYTDLHSIELNGYGSLLNYDTIYHNLNISTFKAYSVIELNVNNDSTIIINELGSTSLKLSGQCQYFYVFSSGVAPMNANDLKCIKAHVHSSSLGDFYINSSVSLIIELRSIGNVYYTGDPIETIFFDQGQGDIIKLN